jgi:signal transduction histidine kinase
VPFGAIELCGDITTGSNHRQTRRGHEPAKKRIDFVLFYLLFIIRGSETYFSQKRTIMLKNLFTIPDTFDPEDYRRRQVLNIILITISVSALISLAVLALQYLLYGRANIGNQDFINLFIPTAFSLVICGLLLVANRSTLVPSLLNGSIFLGILLLLIVHSDTPAQLYDGRSTVLWVLPIVITALILPPGYIFLVTLGVGLLMQFFTPPDIHFANPVNYYSMVVLLLITFFSWLGTFIAERAIRDARREAANLQAIYDHVADGVLVLDLNGGFLSANPAMLAMIPLDDLLGIIRQPFGESLHWNRKVFSISASPVPEVGAVAVFRDETRRHETERARDALLATASHELRTPLAATMNYIELLLALLKLDRWDAAQFKEHLLRALENTRRLEHLVDNILDQAQIQAGALELKREPFELRALLERAHQLLEVFIQQKRLSYELVVAPDVPEEIRGDAGRLQQVLVNLIGNAVKFTDQGGVRVQVSTEDPAGLSIRVTDTGVGIPAEQLPDVFEAFRRGSNYAQRERQGAGLGLSIVKEIVTRMHGEISAISEPGAGSTFTVTIPIEPA